MSNVRVRADYGQNHRVAWVAASRIGPSSDRDSIAAMLVVLILLAPSSGLGDQQGEDNNRPDSIKVAAVQLTGYVKQYRHKPGYDPADAVVRYIERAAGDGATMVVFPEYHLGRIQIPGPETRKIGLAAARHEIYVVVGSWELLPGNEFANAALLFDRDGKIVGKYYKTHAAVDKYEGTPPYARPPQGHDTQWFIENDPEWIMRRGEELPVFELDFGAIGILTCYDGYFPESYRVLSLKGAEIIVWINGRRGAVQDFFVKTAMYQNRVSMICTNQAYGSGTMIAEWPTNILAVCPEAKEDYVVATLNLKRLRQARASSRDFQQRRPALYGEITDPRPAALEAMEE